MDVRLALLTILASVPLTGCPTWNCDPSQEQFQIDDAEVTAAQLEDLCALLAACRARRSSSPVLRRVFAKIAADETAHGQLALALALGQQLAA